MDFRDLIQQHYKFSQSDCSINNGTSTQDYMRDSPLQNPIISSSKQLEMIEREQRQLQAGRVQKVMEISLRQEERQEAILKRVCGKSFHQSTRINHNIRLEPMRNGQSGSFHSAVSSVSHCAPLHKPQRVRRIHGSQAAVGEELYPFRPEDPCTPVELRAISSIRTPVPPAAVAKPSRHPRPLTLYKQVKPVEKACEVPGEFSSWKSSAAVAKLNTGAMLSYPCRCIYIRHENLSPFGEIRRFEVEKGDLRESCRSDESPLRSKCSRIHSGAAARTPQPGKAGLKAARFSQGLAKSYKPAENRDTARAAEISQDKGAVAETPSLVL
ncbi:uncharacterized protein LOC143526132 [Brachyhypopomus gauderio]|uniref:uncharacterized protein LOC143526132 n=1 Tax=Brachyhypopomus gauderio TaxID=698409 RepID=UPI004042AB7F